MPWLRLNPKVPGRLGCSTKPRQNQGFGEGEKGGWFLNNLRSLRSRIENLPASLCEQKPARLLHWQGKPCPPPKRDHSRLEKLPCPCRCSPAPQPTEPPPSQTRLFSVQCEERSPDHKPSGHSEWPLCRDQACGSRSTPQGVQVGKQLRYCPALKLIATPPRAAMPELSL
jgi:hypothetical protein